MGNFWVPNAARRALRAAIVAEHGVLIYVSVKQYPPTGAARNLLGWFLSRDRFRFRDSWLREEVGAERAKVQSPLKERVKIRYHVVNTVVSQP